MEGFWAELALELFLLVDDFVSFQLEDRVEALGANLAHVSLDCKKTARLNKCVFSNVIGL